MSVRLCGPGRRGCHRVFPRLGVWASCPPRGNHLRSGTHSEVLHMPHLEWYNIPRIWKQWTRRLDDDDNG